MNTTATLPTPAKGWNIALWIVQILLAGMFIMAGFMKTTTPIAELSAQMAWTGEMPGLVRFIGISEILGGLGLILPSLLRIRPSLTVLAALGLVTIMVLAAIFHISRGETSAIGMNFLLAGLAGFVAWGRSRKAPILPKA